MFSQTEFQNKLFIDKNFEPGYHFPSESPPKKQSIKGQPPENMNLVKG